jgi:hypothetical protein
MPATCAETPKTTWIGFPARPEWEERILTEPLPTAMRAWRDTEPEYDPREDKSFAATLYGAFAQILRGWAENGNEVEWTKQGQR